MAVPEVLAGVLAFPTAEALWDLRSEMLEAGVPAGSRAWEVLEAYHGFLDHLACATCSREYSDLASKLDVASLSGIVLERVLEPRSAQELASSVFTGLLSEGLMVLATRQHVKAWEAGLGGVYRGAAWFLHDQLWRWTEAERPELPPAERRRLLDRLFDPVRSDATPGFFKALLLGRLFQVLLVASLAAAGAGTRR